MDSAFSTSSRKSIDIPKPENDLADWTSKIKAIQREANVEEGVEQRKLEEEIAAARQARVRRSRGTSLGRASGLDSPLRKEPLESSFSSNYTPSREDQTRGEKQEAQETALRKLMGNNQLYNPDKLGTSVAPSKDANPSLASFIGGRATGPRLNKHSPQPDAHDPSQFIQPDLSAPHPIFGKGGVAMPGMVIKKTPTVDDTFGSESFERYRPSSATRPLSIRKSMDKLPDVKLSVTPRSKSPYEEPARKPVTETPEQFRTSTAGPPRKSPSTSALAQKYLQQIGQSNSNQLSTPAQSLEPPRSPVSTGGFSARPLSSTVSPSTPSGPAKPVKSESLPVKPTPAFSSLPTSSVSYSGYSKPLKSESVPVKAAPSFSSIPSPVPSKPAETTRPAFSSAKSAPQTSSISTPAWEEESKADIPPAKPTPSFGSSTSVTKSFSASPAFSSHSSSKPIESSVGSLQKPGLRNIMASNNVYVPVAPAPPSRAPTMDTQYASLASFIGGNASKPRLNKHAPQPDALDPTQFVQPNTSAPHPVFGRGGIAMPGMVTKKKDDDIEDEYTESSKTFAITDRKSMRERTKSTPAAPSTAVSTRMNTVYDDLTRGSSSRPLSFGYYPNKGDGTTNTPSRPRSVVSTHSLARPLQPRPTTTSFGPQIPAVVAPSPAFQKLPPQKEPTPSLSKLKGRGFVQNMVKVSSQLEGSPTPRTPSPDKNFFGSGKKGAVLERWQPDSPRTPSNNIESKTFTQREPYPRASSASPTKAQPSFHVNDVQLSSSSRKEPFNRAVSASPTKAHLKYPRPSSSMASLHHAPKPDPARAPSPPPLLDDPPPEPSHSRLGSSSTRILIHPSKSSDNLTQRSEVDDFGMKNGTESSKERLQHRTSRDQSPTSGKPLIHLTKERPRKPSKQLGDYVRSDSTFSTPPQVDDEPPAEILPLPLFPSTPVPIPPSQQQADLFPQIIPSTDYPVILALPDTLLSLSRSLNKPELTSHGAGQPGSITLEPTYESDSPPLSPVQFTAAPNALPETPRSPPLSERVEAPPSPTKHRRIPSTGKRATVMEVAQTLHNFGQDLSPSPLATSPIPLSPLESSHTEEATPRTRRAQLQAEKRRSAYDRYSATSLPPLKEELTPVSSPAGTLKLEREPESLPMPHEIADPIEEKTLNGAPSPETRPRSQEVGLPSVCRRFTPNVSKLLAPRAVPLDDPDVHTISLEVLFVAGNAATVINKGSDIFYESEILLIVHRTKSKSSGLASTAIWCWLGKGSTLRDREDAKVREVTKRYGTSAIMVHQLAEPLQLVKVLGGKLKIRQGTRTRWTAENTTMHVVRSYHQSVFIDECDFTIKNLCSGFSYCLTILDSIYVWHGCGSLPSEREVALEYAASLGNNVEPTELTEGVDDDDEIFWMMIGTDEYAKADHWKWRSPSSTSPSVWRIPLDVEKETVEHVEFISMEQGLHGSVYLIDCFWEIFIVVGRNARGHRSRISLAMEMAAALSETTASQRPHNPPIHALILPSQIPLDLHLALRDLDEAWVNEGDIPDHMNLLPYIAAIEQLNQDSWQPSLLKDPSMLPLGVAGPDISTESD